MATVPGALLDEFTSLSYQEKALASAFIGAIDFDNFVFDGKGTGGDNIFWETKPGTILEESVNPSKDIVISDQSITLASRIEHAILIGDLDSNVTGSSAANLIIGNSGDNRLDAGSGNDLVFGGMGNDCVQGGSGNDTLFGGSGEDCIEGGSGNDCIDGGEGNDTLSGGANMDIFHFGKGGGNDTITDFDWWQDGLSIDSSLAKSKEEVFNHAADDGQGNLVITFGDQSITLTDMNLAELKKAIIVIE